VKLFEIAAWSRQAAELSHDEAAQLAGLDLVDVIARPQTGSWELVSNSRIGVASGLGWELRVRPRLAVPNLFFLLAYALNPDGWKDESAQFASHPDLMDAVASGFSWHALRALDQGVLRGYVHVDERLTTIRGRVRFSDQIARNASLPFPVELSYDDYTEDIIENQILKSATLALLRLARLPRLARRRLLKLRAVLDEVWVVARPREVVIPRSTRLNERYAPALQLAAMILRASSIDAPKGQLAATAFVFDMNKVFEDFVTVALGESMERFGGQLRSQWDGRLDRERRLRIIPDLTWWADGACLAVADAKYKALSVAGMPNADAYQMLAYCTALSLPRGFLIYAKDAGEQACSHHVMNTPTVIDVRTLDVEAEPDVLLAQVDVLADEIAFAGRAMKAEREADRRLVPQLGV
jgi:5-methylcytosine-specific restriction enzyme subunit McrC